MFPAAIRVDAESGQPERERGNARAPSNTRARAADRPLSESEEECASPCGELREHSSEPLFRLDELENVSFGKR